MPNPAVIIPIMNLHTGLSLVIGFTIGLTVFFILFKKDDF